MVIIKRSELFIQSTPLGPKNRLILLIFGLSALKWLRKIAELVLHLELPADCLKKRIRLGHPYNIIINPRAVLDRNITVHHNVTIGSKQFGRNAGVPTIHRDAIIYPNVVILGAVSIGESAIIGAGSVVVDDVAPYSVVAGNPARLVGQVLPE